MTREQLNTFLSQFPNFLNTLEGKEGIFQLQKKIIEKYFNRIIKQYE